MKKLITLTLLLALTPLLFGQSNPIDDFFNKYSGKDGFTTVFISSRMFQLIAGADLDEEELSTLMSRLKSIRILTVEDSLMNQKLNFHKELGAKLDFSVYEELMVVKSDGKDLKFLIRGKGNKVDELLMIGGGVGTNILISIKGDLNMKDLSDISKTIGIDELEGIDKKQPTKKRDE
jgi:hypothetical protein